MRELALATVCAAVLAVAIFVGVGSEVEALGSGRTKTQRCLGTVFAQEGDKYAGEHFACTGEAIAKHRGRKGIAHRWLPCGTLVRITFRGMAVEVPVIDRGPYLAYPTGCDISDRQEWIACRKTLLRWRPGWHYRGCIDMTPNTAKAIGHPGWGRVKIEYAWPPKRRDGV